MSAVSVLYSDSQSSHQLVTFVCKYISFVSSKVNANISPFKNCYPVPNENSQRLKILKNRSLSKGHFWYTQPSRSTGNIIFYKLDVITDPIHLQANATFHDTVVSHIVNTIRVISWWFAIKRKIFGKSNTIEYRFLQPLANSNHKWFPSGSVEHFNENEDLSNQFSFPVKRWVTALTNTDCEVPCVSQSPHENLEYLSRIFSRRHSRKMPNLPKFTFHYFMPPQTFCKSLYSRQILQITGRILFLYRNRPP